MPPSFSDFQTNVKAPSFESQLRVLNVLNENFEIDMIALYNEFISAKKKKIKGNITRVLLLNLKKIMLKGNGKKR